MGRGKRSGGSQSRGPDRFRQGRGGGAGHSPPTAGSFQSRAGSPYPGAGPFPCLTPLLVLAQAPGSRGSTSSPAHFCFEPAYCTRAPPTWSTPDPPPVDPHLRAVDAGVIRSLRATVIRTGPLAGPVVRDAKGAPPGAAAGGILRVGGHFRVAGDRWRVRGRGCCPRRRRMTPPGTTRTWPRAMSPSVVTACRMEVLRG